LKTWPNQLLGSLPLNILLPGQNLFLTTNIFQRNKQDKWVKENGSKNEVVFAIGGSTSKNKKKFPEIKMSINLVTS